MPYVYFSVAELETLEDLVKDAAGFHKQKELYLLHKKVKRLLGWED